MTATQQQAGDAAGSGPTKPAARRTPIWIVLDVLGSMKLAVVLLVVLGLLTWLGTLAQIDKGLWQTQREYFESWFLLAELELGWWGEPLWTGEDGSTAVLKIPLPGAYPVMALLFVNLVVGGMLRRKWKVRNVGVLITHLGIALLLWAGFVKMEYSYSGGLALFEYPENGGGDANRVYQSSTFHSFHDYELALMVDRGETIEERVVPESALAGAKDGTVSLAANGLPFRVEVHDWLDNCGALPKGPMVPALKPVVDDGDGGPGIFLRGLTKQPEREFNVPGCYVTVVTDGGERHQGILRAMRGTRMDTRPPYDGRRFPFTFEVDGTRYGLDLRRVVYDLPFQVRLDRFQKRDHPGTMMAADYRSFVTVDDGGQQREVQIFMNTPLRKDGFVAYQTSWGPQVSGRPIGNGPWYSVFEVASNPSDKWPEYSCWVIALGMLIHFSLKLARFLRSSHYQKIRMEEAS